jgi:hypothetical protein
MKRVTSDDPSRRRSSLEKWIVGASPCVWRVPLWYRAKMGPQALLREALHVADSLQMRQVIEGR